MRVFCYCIWLNRGSIAYALANGWLGETNEYISPVCPLGISASFLMIGAGSFVMRTEYLPPRKNALSRAKDKLVEIVNSYQWKPATVSIN